MSSIKPVSEKTNHAGPPFRLVPEQASDPFIVIDSEGGIVQWGKQAQKAFGWAAEEVLAKKLVDMVVTRKQRTVRSRQLKSLLLPHRQKSPGRTMEMLAQRKDGRELSVELSFTPITTGGKTVFSVTLRDISKRKKLEDELRRQVGINRSILDSMAAAVAVADLSERLILVNPAAQRLLDVRSVEIDAEQSFLSIALFKPDRKTVYQGHERPLTRALRGEHVDGLLAFIQHAGVPEGAWVSANARPLKDGAGRSIGGVVIFHDISELKRREETTAQQALMLQEQASLLDLAHNAIMVRSPADDLITYWNRGAEKLYKYSKDEALGQVSHLLLKTRFPMPLGQIQETVKRNGFWEGELVHLARDGREITVLSEWVLDSDGAGPLRYLETNTDITQRVQTERALRQSQENYQLLVESSTDYAIIMMSPDGAILSWNQGAEHILGLSQQEALGQHMSKLFTAEDQQTGEPVRELEEARLAGRSEDDRWHMRRDGSRFWATGVVTPLWNEDGSLRGYVKIMRDKTSQRVEEERTQFLANHDALTGLPNRVSFSNQLHKALALSDRTNLPLVVLLLDLDRFKHVNDTFGHHTGDLLLKEVALRIMSSIRETDFVARLGGDEFVIIQTDVTQPRAAETLARKLIRQLGQPYLLDGQEVLSGTSIGIGVYPKDAKNSVELLKKADLALYRAKHAGRGTFQVYTPDLAMESTWKRDQARTLRRALENHQFQLYYQPQIDLSTWKISTVEALLRWQATEMEMMLPVDFLKIAEETGVIIEIGEWALRQACEQVRKWQAQGMSDLRISVNCSARQFSDPRFVALIPSILESVGLAPAFLEIEVSETMLAEHPLIKEQLAELRSLGIRITIDNFGTGNTALMEFVDFEVDTLKIDKAFVQHLPHRREDSAVASAIIGLARELGVAVVAGGVETAEQLAYLKARDCTSAQGFIFSPPISADKFEELALGGNWSRINRLPPFEPAEPLKNLH